MTETHMAREIAEIPEAAARFLTTARDAVAETAAKMRALDPSLIVTVARGSSDHAGGILVMHDHDPALAVAGGMAGQTGGGVLEGGAKDEDIAPRNVGVVRKGQNVDTPRGGDNAGSRLLLAP